jgi:photosystem II stability/assembly factor-like uncharacterized protein
MSRPATHFLTGTVLILALATAAGAASWISQGPFGGPADSVAIDPVAHAVYAGNFGGGVLKSTDAGLHWAPANNGFGNIGEMTINALAASPTSSGRLIVGTQNGVWLTTNGGASWAATNLVAASPIVEGPDVRAVAFAPSDATRAYAAENGPGGMWRSVDSGAHWTSSVVGITDTFLVAVAVDPTSPNTVYAGSYHGQLFKSTDGGATWTLSGSGIPSSGIGIESLLADPSQPATVIAGTSDGFYRSTDHGATWHPVPGADDRTYSLSAGNFGNIATLYSASRSSGILASTNHGASWSRLDQNLADVNPEAFALDSSTGVAYATNHTEGSAGVERSVNAGVTWSSATNGYAAQYVPAVAFDPQSSKNVLAATYGNGIFRSADAGGTWARTSVPAYFLALLFDRLNPSVAYAVGNVGVLKSVNGGQSWDLINNGLGAFPEFQALAQSGTGSVLLTGDHTGALYRSTDGGGSWHPSATGLTASSINSLAADPHAPGTFFVSTDASIFKTTDGGLHWSPSATGYPAGAPGVTAVDAFDSNVVLAASILDFPVFGQGAWRSTNGGGTWTPLGGPLASETVWTFAADPAHAGVLYAGTYGGGVYRSADHGATWTLFTRTGLTNLRVVALAVSTDGLSIQAGTDSTSTFRYGSPARGPIDVPPTTAVRKVRPRP